MGAKRPTEHPTTLRPRKIPSSPTTSPANPTYPSPFSVMPAKAHISPAPSHGSFFKHPPHRHSRLLTPFLPPTIISAFHHHFCLPPSFPPSTVIPAKAGIPFHLSKKNRTAPQRNPPIQPLHNAIKRITFLERFHTYLVSLKKIFIQLLYMQGVLNTAPNIVPDHECG